MAKSKLGKRKSSGASIENTSASDDEDTSNRKRKSKKSINEALLAAALNSKTHLFKNGPNQGLNNDKINLLLTRIKQKEATMKTSDTTELEEMECKPDLKTPKQAVGKSPKRKKKKREVVSNSEESETEYKSLHHEIQIKPEIEESDDSDAGPSNTTSRVAVDIKREMVNESNESDVESDRESVVVTNQENSSVSNYVYESSQELESDDGSGDNNNASINSVTTSKSKAKGLAEDRDSGRQEGLLGKGKKRVKSVDNSVMERHQQSSSKAKSNAPRSQFQVLQEIRFTPRVKKNENVH